MSEKLVLAFNLCLASIFPPTGCAGGHKNNNGCQHLQAASVSTWSIGQCQRPTRSFMQRGHWLICTTPQTKQPHLASFVCSQHPCSHGTIRSSDVRWQEAGRTDPHTLAGRQECHLGRHRNRHGGAVVSASDVGVVWWGSGGDSREEDIKVYAADTDINLYPNIVETLRPVNSVGL